MLHPVIPVPGERGRYQLATELSAPHWMETDENYGRFPMDNDRCLTDRFIESVPTRFLRMTTVLLLRHLLLEAEPHRTAAPLLIRIATTFLCASKLLVLKLEQRTKYCLTRSLR